MTDPLAHGRLMLAFDGLELPEPMGRRLASLPAAGVTLFRYRNVSDPAQVRALTDAIQRCAPHDEPFLVAADQEGGQLLGLGPGSTPFAGNMALGAADDPDLTERVGRAIGVELRAAGINVNYAPVADLATNPRNPSLGVRSFGADPARVADHVAAMVRGLEASGVASTLKHFPGKGDAGVDTHHELATVDRDADGFESRELVPFRAGIRAGASVVMSGHFAAPGLTDEPGPATLSRTVMRALLRDELAFEGVSISDAFDMDALSPGSDRLRDAVRGMNGGLDLVLLGGTSDASAFDRALADALRAGELDADFGAAALARVRRLRRRLAGTVAGELSVIGSDAHRALAREVAERSITLVADRDGALPLRPGTDDTLLVVMPRPADRTPADTSASVEAGLASAVRRHHPRVDELVVGHGPSDDEVGEAARRAGEAAAIVVGSISSSFEPRQAALVQELLRAGRPVVTAALRTPWDLGTYPAAGTHLCTYSILQPSLDALADVIFGVNAARGRLPVAPWP